MVADWNGFERIVREAYAFTDEDEDLGSSTHPFDERNIHPDLPANVRGLFDDGHFASASLEATKYLDEEIQRLSELEESGRSLMNKAFSAKNPVLPLNTLVSESDRNEQDGYMHIFAGTIVGIRNPRAHTTKIIDTPDSALDCLGLVSLLLRKLEDAGLR